MLTRVLVIAPLLATAACFVRTSAPERSRDVSTTQTPAKHEDPRASFLALGDSYTIGEGLSAAERWPVRLVDMLRHEGVEVGDPVIIARTGWTTDELMTAIDAWEALHGSTSAQRASFDMVSLLIGVNDQYRGRSVESYRPAFVQLLERARGFARGDASHVLVLSIPDWSLAPFAEGRDRARIALELDAYNAVNREETERLGARYVEITSLGRRVGGDAAHFAADGLHPAAAVHDEWANAALPSARAILAARPKR